MTDAKNNTIEAIRIKLKKLQLTEQDLQVFAYISGCTYQGGGKSFNHGIHKFQCKKGHVTNESIRSIIDRGYICTPCQPVSHVFVRECTKSRDILLVRGIPEEVCGCIQHPIAGYIQKTTQTIPLRKLTPEESHLPEYGHNTRQVILDYLYGSPSFQKWQTAMLPINEYIKTRCDGQYSNKALAYLVYDIIGRLAYVDKMRPVFDEHKEIFSVFTYFMRINRIRRPHNFHHVFLRLLERHNKLKVCDKCKKVYVPWKFADHHC